MRLSLHPFTDPASAPSPAADHDETTLQWVPVKRLDAADHDAMLAHLLALDAEDRYLRFGYAASDEQIARYLDGIALDRDDLFGVYNRRLSLVAMAHLAYEPDPAVKSAEYGVSVSAHLRERGFGKRLFAHAILFARNRGIEVLHVHALAENKPMLRIAAGAGAQVERSGSEAEAVLRLPAADAGSRWEAWLETHAAGIDYSVKHLQRMLHPKQALAPEK